MSELVLFSENVTDQPVHVIVNTFIFILKSPPDEPHQDLD